MSNQPKIILGIESSCDETACSICQKDDNRIRLLSNIVASSQSIHIKYGGVVPEQAAREQVKSIIPVITEALDQANLKPGEIDAIAVTQGPGLIGSLLVGVETAKTLSTIWDKPLIPINHLIGHFYANWIDKQSSDQPQFPFLGLLVSGGHSDLVLFEDHNHYDYLGGTRDDAAGECFDKCARILNLPYPGGPQISKLAASGDSTKFKLPRPMMHSYDLDFSFSGLKTAVLNLVDSTKISDKDLPNICAAIETAIIDSLVNKVVIAIKKYNIEQLVVAGGVAANSKLRTSLEREIGQVNPAIKLFVPPPILCTDNAAMIAAAGFFTEPVKNPLQVEANPSLSLSLSLSPTLNLWSVDTVT